MKRRILSVIALWVFLAGVSFADEKTSLIELTDGSSIRGEIMSMVDGVYTVRSSDLGTITIDRSKVRSVRIGTAVDAEPKSARPMKAGQISIGEQVDVLRQAMMGNEELMGAVGSLAGDPQFQAVLQDPELMRAVNSGDLEVLLANPRFMELLNKSSVQDIAGKVTK
jgi:hypothetical protein